MKCCRYIFILLFSLGTISSCDEDYLTEVPKDFLSPENAFVDKAGFEQGLTYIYISIRNDIYKYRQVPLETYYLNPARNPCSRRNLVC